MEAKLVVGVLLYLNFVVDGEALQLDVARVFHEMPFESVEACMEVSKEQRDRITESLEASVRAYWLQAMEYEEGDELVTEVGALCETVEPGGLDRFLQGE